MSSPSIAGAASVEEELLRLLARQGRRVPIPVFLAAGLIAAQSWGRIPVAVSTGWLSLVVSMLVLRWVVLGRLPLMHRPSLPLRLQIVMLLNFANGAIFGSSVGFFPFTSDLERAVLSMVLLGLCAGSVATTAGYMPIFLAYLLPALLPLIVMWWITPGEPAAVWVERSVAVLITLFGLILIALARDSYRLFRESFEIRLQQTDLNRQLMQALAQAETANRAKTRFLASASHDLRQPMHTLSLFSAALSMRPLDTRSRDIAAHMDAALQSLSSLLDTLLDISKLDAGVVAVQRSRFALGELLQGLHREFSPRAQEKGVAMETECPAEAWCLSDPLLLGRVLRNLIDNSVKYTDAGRIRICVHPQGQAWQIDIIDTGPGIPETEHARVFEEFYQLDNPERDRLQGLGLGLSIVQRLSSLLDLRLTLQSKPGLGTVVSLQVGAAETGPAMDGGQRQIEGLLEGLHVLVVDDEEAVRHGMCTLLGSYRCSVAAACGTADAIQLAQASKPDILLADFRLRKNDNGLKTVQALRALYPGLPALLVSGDTAPDRLREAQAAGVRLLHKPVAAEALRRAIEQECNQPGGRSNEARHERELPQGEPGGEAGARA